MITLELMVGANEIETDQPIWLKHMLNSAPVPFVQPRSDVQARPVDYGLLSLRLRMAFSLLQLDPVRICYRKSEIVKGTGPPSKAKGGCQFHKAERYAFNGGRIRWSDKISERRHTSVGKNLVRIEKRRAIHHCGCSENLNILRARPF